MNSIFKNPIKQLNKTFAKEKDAVITTQQSFVKRLAGFRGPEKGYCAKRNSLRGITISNISSHTDLFPKCKY